MVGEEKREEGKMCNDSRDVFQNLVKHKRSCIHFSSSNGRRTASAKFVTVAERHPSHHLSLLSNSFSVQVSLLQKPN